MTDQALSLALALECPDCQGPLATAGELLACSACGRQWPNPGGVAHLGEAPDFPQDFPSDQLAEMLNIAETSGWQTALHDYMRPLDPQRYRHAVDEYRAQWRCLLPQHAAARVLDFRCGWGPITVSLAEDYGEVVAADTRPELARFTAYRAQAAGLRNVRALSLDPRRRLPFPSAHFHIVVLQSALEWGDPNALLREAARVLAPGGWLFVHVPNRLNAAHLLQAAQGWLRRFSAAANDQAPAYPRAAPAPLLRTLGGYRRALAEAGFGAGVTYAVLPSVAEPFYIVPLGSRGALQFFLDNLFNDASLHLALAERRLLAPYQLAKAMWRAARWLPLEPMLRHFMPGYALLAARG